MKKSIEENILWRIREQMGVEAHRDNTFDELGMDSLDRCTLYEFVEKSYGIILEDDAVREVHTVGALIDLVCHLVNV